MTRSCGVMSPTIASPTSCTSAIRTARAASASGKCVSQTSSVKSATPKLCSATDSQRSFGTPTRSQPCR